MKSINLKKLILPNLPYLLFVFLFDKVGQAARLAPGADISGKLLTIGDGFAAAFSSFAPSLYPVDLLVGILGAALIRLVVYVKGKNAKKYRRGAEYGSARWGSADDIRPYIDPVFENNVLLTQTERLILDLLADGKELASEDIVKAAAEAGISERTVQNAKRNMGGILGARRVGGQWHNFIKKKQPPEPAS